MKFRDYYEVLGVPRDADGGQVKRAYCKLARELHPDVSEDRAAGEEKFKELNEAYDVLSDPEKRRKYDALGANWQHLGDFTPPSGSGSAGVPFGTGNGYEFHFDGTGFSDFFEALFSRPGARGRPGG